MYGKGEMLNAAELASSIVYTLLIATDQCAPFIASAGSSLGAALEIQIASGLSFR